MEGQADAVEPSRKAALVWRRPDMV